MTRLTRQEAGVSLIELAISIPLLLFLVSGMIGWWQLVWKKDLMLSASRHGARVAAAKAHADAVEGDIDHACGDTGGLSKALTAGTQLAFNALAASGLERGTCTPSGTPERSCNGDAFRVSAQFETLCEDGIPQQAITVSVESVGAVPCLICFDRIFQGIRVAERSTFAVETSCAAEGGLSCP